MENKIGVLVNGDNGSCFGETSGMYGVGSSVYFGTEKELRTALIKKTNRDIDDPSNLLYFIDKEYFRGVSPNVKLIPVPEHLVVEVRETEMTTQYLKQHIGLVHLWDKYTEDCKNDTKEVEVNVYEVSGKKYYSVVKETDIDLGIDPNYKGVETITKHREISMEGFIEFLRNMGELK